MVLPCHLLMLLHHQLAYEMQDLEQAWVNGRQAASDGYDLSPEHDALVFSGMLILGIDGMLQLCDHIQVQLCVPA